MKHVLTNRGHYDLHEVLIPDVKAISEWLRKATAGQSAASRLLQHCLRELRAATTQPLEPPQDWRRDAELDCGCEDCRALSRFLRDPAQRVGRFPLRQHLHQQIDRHRCDLTHVTEHVGSPQTLVWTKIQASYERTSVLCAGFRPRRREYRRRLIGNNRCNRSCGWVTSFSGVAVEARRAPVWERSEYPPGKGEASRRADPCGRRESLPPLPPPCVRPWSSLSGLDPRCP